ncbi:MAG: CoA pyrophosphatase [Pseudomonadota bacterium]
MTDQDRQLENRQPEDRQAEDRVTLAATPASTPAPGDRRLKVPDIVMGGFDGLHVGLSRGLDAGPDPLIEELRAHPPAVPGGPQTQTPAAVLIAFMRGQGADHAAAGLGVSDDQQRDQTDDLRIVMIRRPLTMRRHAGQIAFPGGRIDPEDADATAAALREASEEVALDPGAVSVVGHLPALATQTGFVVAPVVGLIEHPNALRASPDEVDEILFPPAALLFDPAGHRAVRNVVGRTRMPQLSGEIYNAQPGTLLAERSLPSKPTAAPFEPRLRCAITYREHVIWGASAAIIRVLFERLSAL